jgi:hypothetical protein
LSREDLLRRLRSLGDWGTPVSLARPQAPMPHVGLGVPGESHGPVSLDDPSWSSEHGGQGAAQAPVIMVDQGSPDLGPPGTPGSGTSPVPHGGTGGGPGTGPDPSMVPDPVLDLDPGAGLGLTAQAWASNPQPWLGYRASAYTQGFFLRHSCFP